MRPGAARQRLRITHVLGDITTVVPKRKKPTGAREAFQTGGKDESFELVDIKVEDLASVLLRFDNGAKGAFSVGQVCAGHKNDLVLEVCGSKASLRWRQEDQNELWIGHRDRANEILQKDPSLLDAECAATRTCRAATRKAGPTPSATSCATSTASSPRARRRPTRSPPAFATFEDGYRANAIVEAILDSAKRAASGRRLSY